MEFAVVTSAPDRSRCAATCRSSSGSSSTTKMLNVFRSVALMPMFVPFPPGILECGGGIVKSEIPSCIRQFSVKMNNWPAAPILIQSLAIAFDGDRQHYHHKQQNRPDFRRNRSQAVAL